MRINEVLETDRDVAQRDPKKQFDLLIAKPLQRIRAGRKPILIVIDALDECKSQDTELILTLLSQNIRTLPCLKVFITARPEQNIRNSLDDYRDHEQFHLHDIEDSIVEADIRLYIHFRLSEGEVRKALRSLQHPLSSWQPTEGQKEKLVGISGKLFIIASTAAPFILDSKQLDPAKQFALLLDGVSSTDFSGSKHTTIMDHVYMQIIHAARPNPIGDWVDRFRTFVGTIALLHDPLPCEALAGFLVVDANDVLRTLANLHSLLAPRGEHRTFRIHHKSFRDFITDPSRCTMCPEFCISPMSHHLRIAKRCLLIMDQGLRPNICNLTPEERYQDRTELYNRIRHCISPDLAYSCIYWASHLDAGLDDGAEPDAEVTSMLEHFASRDLLTWFEVLSIIGRVDTAYPSLNTARRIMHPSNFVRQRLDHPQFVANQFTLERPLVNIARTILSDMCRVIQRSSDTLRLSPLNIYQSALPFVPHRTALFHTYKSLYTDRADVISGLKEVWPPEIAVLRGHSHSVQYIIFSPDGSRLASASVHEGIRLWDGRTGAHIATLKGRLYQSDSRHIAFSPDGSRLAWISSGGGLLLWNGGTGAHVATLEASGRFFKLSLSLSPDGSRLASGSRNGEVLLWDTITGRLVAPLADHPDAVNSVIFSPDGSRLASASVDGMVLHDGHSGVYVASVKGNGVASIEFSPDGSRLAFLPYASPDTALLLDGQTGRHVATLEHRCAIALISFSPNSAILASASIEPTVELWNGYTGAHIATLTAGATTSIKFSSNGLRLALASLRGMVTLWNGNTGVRIATLQRGPGAVTSIEFSPDGSRLASASYGTAGVRVWDARRGTLIATFDQITTVRSLAFSPDGSRIASASGDTTVRLLDGEIGNIGYSYMAIPVTSPPNGPTPALVSKDEIVRFGDQEDYFSKNDGNTVISITFSPDGSRFITNSEYDIIRLWDGRTGARVFSLRAYPSRGDFVTFSPDWSTLSLQLTNGSVLLNGKFGARITPLNQDLASSTVFSPDGSITASWTVNDIVLSGRGLGIQEDCPLGCNHITFSPNGSRLAMLSRNTAIQLWNARTTAHIATLMCHPFFIAPPEFSPDSSLFIAKARTGSACLHDGSTGAHIATLPGKYHWTTSSAGKSQLALLSWDGTLQLLDNNGAVQHWAIRKPVVDYFFLATLNRLYLLEERKEPMLHGLSIVNLTDQCLSNTSPCCWFPPDIIPHCLAVNPSGTIVAVGCTEGRVLLLDVSRVVW